MKRVRAKSDRRANGLAAVAAAAPVAVAVGTVVTAAEAEAAAIAIAINCRLQILPLGFEEGRETCLFFCGC